MRTSGVVFSKTQVVLGCYLLTYFLRLSYFSLFRGQFDSVYTDFYPDLGELWQSSSITLIHRVFTYSTIKITSTSSEHLLTIFLLVHWRDVIRHSTKTVSNWSARTNQFIWLVNVMICIIWLISPEEPWALRVQEIFSLIEVQWATWAQVHEWWTNPSDCTKLKPIILYI